MDKSTPPKNWDETVDVLVVGTGFAGLSAAIEAKLAGRSVVVIEKTKGYGGNSVISDGVMAAAGTPLQKAAGIEDSPDLMAQDMMKAGLGLNHPELVKTVAENSIEALKWTINYLNVRYQDRIDQFGGHSVARCFTTINRSGSEIIRKQVRKCKELGIRIRLKTFLKNVFLGNGNSVSGVSIRESYAYPNEDSGVRKSVKIKRGLVLATGGFGNDIAFRTAQNPRLDDSVGSTNKYSATAESLKKAIRIGALPVHLSWIQLGPWACPDEKGYGIGPDFASYIAFPYGILVNPSTGKRIVNELGDRKLRADAILNVGTPCICLTDKSGVEYSGHSIDRCLKKSVVKSFETIAELANYYGIPEGPLQDTIKRFNGFVKRSFDKEFGKPILPDAQPLKTPPYCAIRLWPKVHYTMGGILIDKHARVLDLSKNPIKHLYAAGEVTGGVHGACRLGSCSITECLVFGRIAGKNAATLT
jgi:flavocytochrome c